MTRLDELTVEPITPQALQSAVRKGDPTLCATAVALRDSWAKHAELQKAKVTAENATALSTTQLKQLSQVMGAKPEEALKDLTDLMAYAKRMKEVARLLMQSIAVLQQGADVNVVAAANSIDVLVATVEVPPVVTR